MKQTCTVHLKLYIAAPIFVVQISSQLVPNLSVLGKTIDPNIWFCDRVLENEFIFFEEPYLIRQISSCAH